MLDKHVDTETIEEYKTLAERVIDAPAETASVVDSVWLPTGNSLLTRYEDPGVIDYALKSAAAITALLAERESWGTFERERRRQLEATIDWMQDKIEGLKDWAEDHTNADGDTIHGSSAEFDAIIEAQAKRCAYCGRSASRVMRGDTGKVYCTHCDHLLWEPKKSE